MVFKVLEGIRNIPANDVQKMYKRDKKYKDILQTQHLFVKFYQQQSSGTWVVSLWKEEVGVMWWYGYDTIFLPSSTVRQFAQSPHDISQLISLPCNFCMQSFTPRQAHPLFPL